MIGRLKGAVAYLDESTEVGRTEKELKERTEGLLERITNYGFHLRPEKCDFLKSRKHLGSISYNEGHYHDPQRL